MVHFFSSLWQNLWYIASPHSIRTYGTFLLLTPSEPMVHFFSSLRQNLWYISSPHSVRTYGTFLLLTPTESVACFFSSHWPNQSYIHYSYERMFRSFILIITAESNVYSFSSSFQQILLYKFYSDRSIIHCNFTPLYDRSCCTVFFPLRLSSLHPFPSHFDRLRCTCLTLLIIGLISSSNRVESETEGPSV
jgi:hypothetical protein